MAGRLIAAACNNTAECVHACMQTQKTAPMDGLRSQFTFTTLSQADVAAASSSISCKDVQTGALQRFVEQLLATNR